MRSLRLPALLLAALALSGCATSSSRFAVAAPAPTTVGAPAQEVRLGYFPNLTHATAVYGDAAGTFADALGDTTLRTQQFNAGPAAVEALFGGAVDAVYLGPNPTVNAFVQSQGQAVRVVAGASSGGASLVVRPGIRTPADLAGTRIASPQAGGTQDIALRHYLAEHGYDVDRAGAGDVTVVAQDNATTVSAFRAGEVDGAWLPEPWASRLVLEAGAEVLVDEADLWPGGRFVTSQLVVRTEFLRQHPQTVRALVTGSVEANRQIAADPERAQQVVDDALARLTGQRLDGAVLDRAFAAVRSTDDPLAAALATAADHAFATGLVEQADLRGLYDLRFLRDVLGTPVSDAGLGGPA